MKNLLFASAFIPILISCASGSSKSPIAVLVEIERPDGLTDAALTSAFRDAVPTYESVSGLQRKYFVHSNTQFGGIYLWDDQDSADAFFSDAWDSRIQATYGQSAVLTQFDVPSETPGASPGTSGEDGVATIVKVSAPWYAPRGTIASRMEQSIPQYSSLPGLDYKLYSIADGKRVGGIYLWDNKAAAEAFYNADWNARILETYGEEADVSYYNAPVIVVNTEASN